MNLTCTLRHHRDSRRLASQFLRLVQQRGMNRERLRAALVFADAAHLGQFRKSGEPFISHPLLVATLVAEWGGQEDDVMAALLHDTHEDNPHISLEALGQTWGWPVQQRVQALSKDHAIPPEVRMLDAHGRLLQGLARFGAGLGSTKLADRVHNSVTSQALSARKLTQLQQENQHFFAPLAEHLGAVGLGRFLRAEPPLWWRASSDFLGNIRHIQTPFLA